MAPEDGIEIARRALRFETVVRPLLRDAALLRVGETTLAQHETADRTARRGIVLRRGRGLDHPINPSSGDEALA